MKEEHSGSSGKKTTDLENKSDSDDEDLIKMMNAKKKPD